MLEKIGVREFRENLAKYIDTVEPIAIVRHGRTVGYFFPTQIDPAEAEIAALKQAAEKLDLILQANGVAEDELVEEFRQIRKHDR
jgi:antitoxin (DNA-binding transcriptional repressor) of toxin-antitoxin stability system